MNKKDVGSSGFYKLFHFASTISKYSDEEFAALCGRIPMTAELFENCLKTAFSAYDFESIKDLERTYPVFAKKSAALAELKKIYRGL